jgi:Na+/H+-dicarboxylate symporter
MANNEILSLVVFSIFFGIATSAAGEHGKVMTRAIDALAQVMLKITAYVMQFAPVGVFGALAAVVALQGGSVLINYAYLILCFLGGLVFFMAVILGAICYACRIPYIKLLKAIREPMVLAFSTASSEAAYPQTINALRKFGCPDKIITFVLPLGYSFNMDGSIMYMIFATGFIAQAYGIHLSLETQITMILVLWVTSKGMAGVPRASLVVIAGTLAQFNIPTEGLLLLLGIDAILDMGRTVTNVVGNAVATAVISKWEGQLVLVNE